MSTIEERMETEAMPQSRFKASRPMDAEGVKRCLEANRWGTLALVDGGRPYAIPTIFGWNGEDLYIVGSSGRKIGAIEACSSACFTVTEVKEGGHRWRSVVVEGTAEFVEDVPGKVTALLALRSHLLKEVRRVTMSDVAQLAHARVIRIRPVSVTGRSTRWEDED